jgi:hypothetical protein
MSEYQAEVSNLAPLVSEPIKASESKSSRIQATREWVRKRKLSLAVGASALSLAAGAATNPIGDVLHTVETKAAWVVPTEIGLDVGIGVGAAMMLTSAGIMVRNPMKAKQRLKELPEKANNSLLFKTGFALSTGAAVGWGGVAIGSIIAYLPQESWGTLAFPAVDLASTVALRKIIWSGIHEAGAPPETSSNS